MPRAALPSLLLPACLAGIASASAATPQVFRLQPEPMSGVAHGRVEVVRGDAGPDGHRFFLDRLNVLTPVSVTLMGADAADNVELLLTKYAWDRPLRQGSTTDAGLVNFRFRTEGEFQATVRSDRPGAPYQLVVWVGDEIEPQLAPVLVPASGHGDAAGRAWWPWALAALATAAVLAGLAWLLRGRGRA